MTNDGTVKHPMADNVSQIRRHPSFEPVACASNNTSTKLQLVPWQAKCTHFGSMSQVVWFGLQSKRISRSAIVCIKPNRMHANLPTDLKQRMHPVNKAECISVGGKSQTN